MDSLSGGSDVLSQDSSAKQRDSRKKARVSISDTVEYMSDSEIPAYFSTSACSCKPEQEAAVSRKIKHHPSRVLGFVHKWQDPSKAQSTSNMSADEVLAFAPAPHRKTHQQFGQENKAATIIQSAWRGSHASQNTERMNKAATKIQAMVRGYLTRKELPLGLCSSYRWSEEQKKTRPRKQNRSFPTSLSCHPQHGLDFGRPAERECICSPSHKPKYYPKMECVCLPSHKPKYYPKAVIEKYPPLNLEEPFERASNLQPSRTGFPSTSLPRALEKQRYQEAAATIQAAWRAHQNRQKKRPFVQVNRYPFPPNVAVKQTVWKNLKLGCTFPEEEIQQILENTDILLLSKAPRVRNINIRAVVKGLPVSSPMPNISVEVKSPHAVIQGFQRDLSSGIQAVYTMRNASASGMSQILVHVNTQKGKMAFK